MKLCSCKRVAGMSVVGVLLTVGLVLLSSNSRSPRIDHIVNHFRLKELKDIGEYEVLQSSKSDGTPSKAHRHLRRPLRFRNYSGEPTLPKNVTDQVETFVFFVGYPRSGHSIVGSIMDAHPNMVIAHEFMLFKRWSFYESERIKNGTPNALRDKKELFSALYRDSCKDAERGLRSEGRNKKGYTLEIGFKWQGKFDQELRVIGDKSGGMTTFSFIGNSTKFKEIYQQLVETVQIPVRVIHVVRNPYDLISTNLLYLAGKKLQGVSAKFVAKQKQLLQDERGVREEDKFSNDTLLEDKITFIFRMARAVTQMIEYIGEENVLEIHNSDLVMDARGTIGKICTFLNVKCPSDYLKATAEKVFKHISKTRDLVHWPEGLRELVEEKKAKYPFFDRYSFESNF